MIDLHLHTTASDGLLPPATVIARAAAAGLTIISVTDHDTVAGVPEASLAAGRLGVRLVSGIEITAVESGQDVHVLGYFVDPDRPALQTFLREQRAQRIRRVREIGGRLQALGVAVDVEPILAAGVANRSVGRPAIADALIEAGYAADRDDAFARFLASGRPAFVPRQGPPAADVIAVIHASGGIASLAHPGLLENDALIPLLAGAGLDALEVWHTDHSPREQVHYADLARRYHLALSGGSDYHGEGVHRDCRLGAVSLPADEFARLEALTRSPAPRGAPGPSPAGLRDDPQE